MSLTLLIWIFVTSLLVALFFSSVSYSLRTMSRVRLEEALIQHKRMKDLEAILSRQYDLALIASILRLAANMTAMVGVAWYFLQMDPGRLQPWKIFSLTILVTVPAFTVFSVAIPQAWGKYAGEHLLAIAWPLLKMLHFVLCL